MEGREAEDEAGDRQGGKDARKGGKARDKKDSWKERGDKKDAWKERRRETRRGNSTADAEAGGAPPARREGAGEAGGAQDRHNRGNALLTMLKANPPSATRYSREELLSIGQLPASRVKPMGLHMIIDKENTTSPLLLKPKADKVSRRKAAEGEEEDNEEDGRKERRDRAAHRGGHSDGEDGAADPRRAGGRRAGDRWKEEDRRPAKAEDSWDMPDANASNQGDLADFTLGDIRKAEKSISGGMSMKDYKASLRAGGAAEPGAEVGHKERDDPFKVDGNAEGASLFVEEEEEDEDVSRASRGFGKWFGSRPEPEVGPGAAAPWGAPPGSLQSAVAAQMAGTSRPSEPPPLAAPGIPGMTGDVPLVEDGAAGKGHDVTGASNLAGRSILSMLARPEPAAAAAAAAAADMGPGNAAAQDRHGKLSVAELFHLAQGKELPPLPPTANPRGADGVDGEAPERRAQREALQMAHLMWAAAAKSQQPPAMPGSRFPGYQPGPCGGAAAAAFGGVGRGAGAGSEQQHLLQEAYAAQAAMLGMGQAPWPPQMPSGCPPYGGPRGYGAPQPYNAYGFAPGYAQMPRGPGYDVAAGVAQARPPPAPAAQPGYGIAAPRPKAAPEKAPAMPAAAAAKARQPPVLGSPPLGPSALGSAPVLGAPGAEANEEEAGCSQS